MAWGGDLASIHNDEVNIALSEHLPTIQAWIGFNDNEIEGLFEWSDGTPSNYEMWSDWEPNNYGWEGENCATLDPNRDSGDRGSQWNDLNC